MRRSMRQVLQYRPALLVALVTGFIYLFLYLYSLGDLVVGPRSLVESAPSLTVVDGWPSRMFKLRVAFSFEPIAALYLTTRVGLMLSPINVLLGAGLAALVGLNIGFVVFAIKRPQACPRASKKGLLYSVPGLLLGFGCCAPTLLLALGSAGASLTLGFIALRTVFYPLSIAGMLVSLWLNLRRIQPTPSRWIPST